MGAFLLPSKSQKFSLFLKTSDPEKLENYRPISNLPAFSKLYEKVVYNRIYKYLTTHNLLYNNQFGFRRNHSTYMALIQLVNNITSAMDNRGSTAGVFLGLSKAFDTVDHHILLNKLDHYGIRRHSFNWVSSYLANRIQLVQFTSACSQPEPIVCGVPQGSILGPLLFIIYINNLPNASNLLKTFLFADDTSLFYSHKDPNQLIRVMNCELSKISEWLKVNKLSLNVAKTNYILFRPRQKPITVSDTITLDNIAFQQVEVTKFLGVLLDQHLSWKYHINHVTKKSQRL